MSFSIIQLNVTFIIFIIPGTETSQSSSLPTTQNKSYMKRKKKTDKKLKEKVNTLESNLETTNGE